MAKNARQSSINQQISPLIPERFLSELPKPPLIQVNRYLPNPTGTGYRIPDVSIPDADQIFDATIGNKFWSNLQVKDFFQFSGGGSITIVRPTQVGGSYSVVTP